nr:transposase [Cupriavidus sp. amp6]
MDLAEGYAAGSHRDDQQDRVVSRLYQVAGLRRGRHHRKRQLMPRIRNWKDLRFYKAEKGSRYKTVVADQLPVDDIAE